MSRKESSLAFDRGEKRPVLRVLYALDRIYSHCYHRLEVRSACPIPPRGPAILTCNHTSGLDPLLIQAACPRPIVWMMAREFYELPSLNWLFRAIDAIPVGRGGRDMAAMRSAMRALHAGRVLGVFPEGRIEPTRRLMPFQTGVALMAARTGVSVYPAYLDGTQRRHDMLPAFLIPQEASLTFGRPIPFRRTDPDRDALDAATQRIQAATEALRGSCQLPVRCEWRVVSCEKRPTSRWLVAHGAAVDEGRAFPTSDL